MIFTIFNRKSTEYEIIFYYIFYSRRFAQSSAPGSEAVVIFYNSPLPGLSSTILGSLLEALSTFWEHFGCTLGAFFESEAQMLGSRLDLVEELLRRAGPEAARARAPGRLSQWEN